jgi:hypothetical protein
MRRNPAPHISPIHNPQSAIIQSTIDNRHSANLQSAICSLQSGVCGVTSQCVIINAADMVMNPESRQSLALFVAQVAMLQQAINRDASREQVLARISLLDTDALALADLCATEDPELGEAIRRAWQDPARVIAAGK